MDLTVNITEIAMGTSDIVRLGAASVETKGPMVPPIFFDGVTFQFYRFA